MSKKIAVIIPEYNRCLTKNKQISLEQVKNVLKNYDIFFVLPDSLRISYASEEIKEKRYSDKWFSSRRMYSKFMLEPQLYKDFSEYDYILIYQLDAFVFKDELSSFCDLDYDYIGAPWLDGVYFKSNGKQNMWYVGNGGFSLRKVDSFIEWTLKADYRQYVDFINEDILISAWRGSTLNIAPIESALLFSFEMNCSDCMKLTEGRLPFGCHAWEKHDFNFWRPYIEAEGYTVEAPMVKPKTVDLTNEMNRFCIHKHSGTQIYHCLPSAYSGNECRGVYIWGTGLWAILLMDKFIENNIRVEGFVDNNSEQWGKKILSYDIVCPELIYIPPKVIVIAIMKESDKVEKQLHEHGYRKEIDYTTVQCMIRSLEN